MERPGPALIGSIVVHAAVIGVVLLAMMFGGGRPERQIVQSIPVSILSGTGRGAQLGILLKGPEVLESTRKVETFVVD